MGIMTPTERTIESEEHTVKPLAEDMAYGLIMRNLDASPEDARRLADQALESGRTRIRVAHPYGLQISPLLEVFRRFL